MVKIVIITILILLVKCPDGFFHIQYIMEIHKSRYADKYIVSTQEDILGSMMASLLQMKNTRSKTFLSRHLTLAVIYLNPCHEGYELFSISMWLQ